MDKEVAKLAREESSRLLKSTVLILIMFLIGLSAMMFMIAAGMTLIAALGPYIGIVILVALGGFVLFLAAFTLSYRKHRKWRE